MEGKGSESKEIKDDVQGHLWEDEDNFFLKKSTLWHNLHLAVSRYMQVCRGGVCIVASF